MTATKQEYPVEPIPEESIHDNPKIFIAIAGIIAIIGITLAVVIWQFRQEITKFLKRLPLPSRVKLLVWRLRKS